MIRSIVFDMGNVLMRWDPDGMPRHFIADPEDARAVGERMFGGDEWQALDAGTVEEPIALGSILADLPERLRAPAERLFRGWQDYFEPIPETNELARELKGKGYGVYLLSNAGTRFGSYCQNIPAYGCFDGGVVSAYVRQVKPGREIYETLLNHYGLRAEECFFIDDMPANVGTAREAGMPGFVYGGDLPALREALREAGVDA